MKKILLVLALLVPLAIVGVMVREASQRAQKKVTPRRLLTKWAGATFTPISESVGFDQAVNDALKAKMPAERVNAQQEEALFAALRTFLRAYNLGSFDAFEKFRFPVDDGQFDPGRIQKYLKMLDEASVRPAGLSEEKPREVVKQIWETYGKVGEMYCTACWDSVDLSSFNFVYLGAMPAGKLAEFVVKSENVGGSMTLEPLVRYSSSTPSATEKTPSVPSTAILSVTIKDKAGAAYPVYVWYDWRAEAKKWLPREISLAYWSEKQLFLF